MEARMIPISTANAARSRPISGSAAVIAAALIGLAGVYSGTAQAQVPTVNIAETCRVAAQVTVNLSGGTSQNDLDICLKGENDAREQMIKNWSTFEPSDRAGCMQPNAYLPSYIEWLTCFEMNKQVREMRQRGQVMQDVLVKNRDGSYTLPTLPYFGKGKTYY
jgi:hypothetical protein